MRVDTTRSDGVGRLGIEPRTRGLKAPSIPCRTLPAYISTSHSGRTHALSPTIWCHALPACSGTSAPISLPACWPTAAEMNDEAGQPRRTSARLPCCGEAPTFTTGSAADWSPWWSVAGRADGEAPHPDASGLGPHPRQCQLRTSTLRAVPPARCAVKSMRIPGEAGRREAGPAPPRPAGLRWNCRTWTGDADRGPVPTRRQRPPRHSRPSAPPSSAPARACVPRPGQRPRAVPGRTSWRRCAR
jgi:hypothetical protein